jgi:hypothetical protein
MKRSFLSEENVNINDIYVPEDSRNAGYNIGDLLNMPYLRGLWPNTPHLNEHELYRMNLLGTYYNESILQYYCKGRKNNEEKVPNIPLIIDSTKTFLEKNIDRIENVIDVVKNNNTCCIHIRLGDVNLEKDFLDLVIKMADKFEKIIILCGLHSDTVFQTDDIKKRNLINCINDLLEKKENIFFYNQPADIHLSIMHVCSNLLLHKGGFSCLGSIVATGKIYITKYFEYDSCIQWKENVNKEYNFINI